MAIGRISGPMLYSNLERQGVDLAIEGNLIYADVTQLRVGINTNTPDADLQVVGQSHLGNIVVTGNVISSTTGHVNLGSTANVVITGGANDYVLVTDGAGNLRWDEISNLDQTWGNLFFSGNQISITQLNGNLELAANGSGYVVATNNLYAPNIVAGNVDAVYFNGNIRSAEIVAAGNITAPNVESTFYGNLFGDVAGTNGTFTGNVNAEYFNGNVRSNNIIATGNVTAQYFVGDLSGNIVGALQGNVTGNISGSNAVFTGNISANWFNGNITGTNSNFTTANAAIFYGNIFAQQVTAPIGDLHLSAATNDPNNIIRFDSVSAFDIPSGTTAQRPPTPDYGYVRYNTDIGSIEWWGGSSWVPGSNLIVSENITPDGINAVYTLGQTTTENAILVNINGTIQQAGAGAYSVAGNQITFAEVPLVTDIIEIRYIAGGVAALSVDFANIAGNVSPSANVTYDLGSPNYRWRDLWLSGNTINLGSASLSAVGNTIQLPAGSTVGGANVDVTSINANVAAANAAIITANTAMKSYVDQGLADALFVAGSYGNVTVAAYLPSDPTITTIRANLGAYQTYANANVVAIQANLGAYQTYANANVVAIRANLGAYQTYANANVVAIQANLGAYQTYANANLAAIRGNLGTIAANVDILFANAQSQQTFINNVNNSAIATLSALDANIGRFYTYANTKIGTNTNSNLVVNSAQNSDSLVSGALVVKGGLGVGNRIYTNDLVVLNESWVAGVGTIITTKAGNEYQDGGITTTDVDLTSFFTQSSNVYHYVVITVQGQYVPNPDVITTQSRLLKSWSAGVWFNESTGFWVIEGEVLQHTVFNSDATNFGAGAATGGKAFLTGEGSNAIALRFNNRTSPAVNSYTYWAYKLEIIRF
jgi:hypothetical protein